VIVYAAGAILSLVGVIFGTAAAFGGAFGCSIEIALFICIYSLYKKIQTEYNHKYSTQYRQSGGA
jgi:hypothetical protein